uniref:Uncharacterized protein n=1 Tax=Spongospora subterranea TaxID=70186 RepID=A0A0H5R3J8_9EUKA|eukprot:CRZ08743.1 hypothetical protein [Spongospora subterranea]
MKTIANHITVPWRSSNKIVHLISCHKNRAIFRGGSMRMSTTCLERSPLVYQQSFTPNLSSDACCVDDSHEYVVELSGLILIDCVSLESTETVLHNADTVIMVNGRSLLPSVIEPLCITYNVIEIVSQIRLRSSFVLSRHVAVSVNGFRLSISPRGTCLIKLLNCSAYFRRHNFILESIYADLLSGLAMIDSRLYIQASEVLKIAAQAMGEYVCDSSNTENDLPLICSSDGLLILAAAALVPTSKMFEMLEILISIAGRGQQTSLGVSFDPVALLSSIQSNLIPKLCKLVIDNPTYICEAAARTIEFVLECLGCDCFPSLPRIIEAPIWLFCRAHRSTIYLTRVYNRSST